MRSKWSKCIQAACCGLILGFGSIVLGQPKPAATPPTTQPAVINLDPFAGDSKVSPELAAKLKAKLITFNVTNTPVLTALDQLGKQVGYQIKPAWDNVFRGNRTNNVTLSAVDQPFWQVLRDICVRGNVTIYNNGGDEDRVIHIAPGNYMGPSGLRGTVSIEGPFLLVPSYIERENAINMATPDKVNRNIHIQAQIYIEPSVVVSQMSYDPIVDEATDDHGNSMANTIGRLNPLVQNRNMQQSRGIGGWCRISMPYPTTNPGTHITKIKGHMTAMVAGGKGGTFEVPDPLNAAESTQTIAGQRMTFKSLKKENNAYRLELQIFTDGRDMQELFNGGGIRYHLTDARGNEARSFNQGASGNGDSVTQFRGFAVGRGCTGQTRHRRAGRDAVNRRPLSTGESPAALNIFGILKS